MNEGDMGFFLREENMKRVSCWEGFTVNCQNQNNEQGGYMVKKNTINMKMQVT